MTPHDLPLFFPDAWQVVIDDNLPHTEEPIRVAAVAALHSLCSQHYCSDREVLQRSQEKLIGRYMAELDSKLHFAR